MEKNYYTNEELFQLLMEYHNTTKKTFTQIAQECGLNRQQLNSFKMNYKK